MIKRLMLPCASYLSLMLILINSSYGGWFESTYNTTDVNEIISIECSKPSNISFINLASINLSHDTDIKIFKSLHNQILERCEPEYINAYVDSLRLALTYPIFDNLLVLNTIRERIIPKQLSSKFNCRLS